MSGISPEGDEVLESEIASLAVGFDLLSDHVIIADTKGIVLYMNPAAEKKTGFSKEEIIGQNGGKIWGHQMGEKFYASLWETILVQKKAFSGEVKNIKKDGTEYWAELRITPVLNDNGDVHFFIAIEPDITERKIEDEKLFESKAALSRYLNEREVRMVELKKQIRTLEEAKENN